MLFSYNMGRLSMHADVLAFDSVENLLRASWDSLSLTTMQIAWMPDIWKCKLMKHFKIVYQNYNIVNVNV